MKRFVVMITLVLLMATGTAQARTYKIGTVHWIAFSPVNVAEVNGFWKNQGIDVQVINFTTDQKFTDAFENKAIDIGIDMIGDWVGMYQTGISVKIICETDWSNGGDKIIAKQNLDLSKMKGITIGVYLDKPAVTFFLNQYLSSHNLKYTDVNIIELPPESLANNFIADRVKMIVNYDPQALRAERKGKGLVVATSALYPGCMPEGFAILTDVLKGLPSNDLAKIFKGWTAAVKWIKDPKNWAEYQDILNAKTFQGELPYSEDDLKLMLNAVTIHDGPTNS
ncbi:MAG: ABC transporter substrate-binding protein [Deltaproteobacteria bacterium]|nr:ABC transporter substrate-binding protein [Deltaproteobacteria bacterium]